MSSTLNIELIKFRGNNSTLFTGRTQGEDARTDLKLDSKDKDNNKYIFVIPKGTTSFNPSFYLGLLFDSYKKLNMSGFGDKYSFKILDEEEPERINRVTALKEDLDDGKRNAELSLNKKSIFDRYFGND